MFSKLVPVLVRFLALTSASILQDAGGQITRLSPVASRLPVNIANGEFTPRINASNGIRIQCDGEKYGFNPNVPDCQNARSFYTRSSKLYTYGERHSGHDINVFPLPYRLMGGILPQSFKYATSLYTQNEDADCLADAALCYLEPVLIDSALGIGTASINHLSNAAFELILQCAVRQSKGGIATGIGTLQESRSCLPISQ